MKDCVALQDGRLTERQKSAYWNDGYLFPIRVADDAQTHSWRAALEEIERTWLDNGLPLPLNTYKRVNAQVVMPLACEIGLHGPILDAVEGVLGPDVMLYSVEFLTKEAHTKHVVTMHQDLAYWGMGDMDNILTAWLALSPATTASGCMDFVQGSHKNEILAHEDSFDELNLLSRGQEIAVDVADADKVPVELAPGCMSLHHGLTIHGSGPNQSDDRRIGVAIRYVSTKMRKAGGNKDYAILARGAVSDASFITYAPPEALFDGPSMALYAEIRDEQAKVMMAGAKSQSAIY
ncbi:phytanoyl-CoA dioxygenase family protein [uncultured Sulfitobacter sp.]|uniref:phytanoyl-CoA dioxygenase family protein n=1 Tax=uncultured Sulfitobacter sp. TaxID=191468 RepID=UPI00261B506D|nr:phytanoyl-CoA dioxygenase family protein [uncultured Sulfitobacter sp.]